MNVVVAVLPAVPGKRITHGQPAVVIVTTDNLPSVSLQQVAAFMVGPAETQFRVINNSDHLTTLWTPSVPGTYQVSAFAIKSGSQTDAPSIAVDVA